MLPSDNLERLQDAWRRSGDRSYLVEAVYVRDATGGSVLLVAGIEEETGNYVVLLREWNRIHASKFVNAIQERLITLLAHECGVDEVRVVRLHDMPIWYVP